MVLAGIIVPRLNMKKRFLGNCLYGSARTVNAENRTVAGVLKYNISFYMTNIAH